MKSATLPISGDPIAPPIRPRVARKGAQAIAVPTVSTNTPRSRFAAALRTGGDRTTDKRRKAGAHVYRTLGQLSPATWAAVDIAFTLLATALVYRLLIFPSAAFEWVVNPWLAGVTFSVCVTGAGTVFGLYERQTLLARSRILLRSTVTLALGVAIAYAFLTVVMHAHASRWLGLSVVAVYICAVVPLRLVAHELITNSRTNLLCVGTGDSLRKVVSLLRNGQRSVYQVVGHVRVREGPARSNGHGPNGRTDNRLASSLEAVEFERVCPCLGTIRDIRTILETHDIDEVVVDAGLASDPAVGEVVLTCLDKRCRVADQPTFVEELLGEVPAEDITPQWFLLANVHPSGSYETVKRILDVVVSILGLAITLPFWLLVALAIRLDSRGSAIFNQARVGRHGRVFSMFKFRTMRADAENGIARWAARNDDRVTRVGRFLRKTRIDELPQLWNILRGDMSLVGPRPERPEFVDQLSEIIPHYRQRHLIKPGLTGWAQIHYRYGASVNDAHRKLCFDLYYLKHRTIDLDVGILIRTLGTFLVGSR